MSKRMTATQAGWRESKFNICAWRAGEDGPLIANLFAGTLGAYSLLEYALLKSLDSLPDNHAILARFADRGLIVNFDERERLASLRAKRDERPKRLKLTICPTMNCNFDCPYCFQSHHAGKMSEAVQDDVVALADRLLETTGAEELSLAWYGGEPLLALDVMERLTRHVNATCAKYGAGLRAQLFTNGYLLDEQTAKKLARLRIKHVRVTIDGMRATHDATRHLIGGGDTFDRIIENLSAPLPFPIKVRQNVHKGNRGDAEALRTLVSRLAEKSGNRIVFHEAEVFDSIVSQGRDDAPELLGDDEVKHLSLQRSNLCLHGAKGLRCLAQTPYGICIDEKGRLYSCSAVLALPEYSFGNAQSWDPSCPDATATAPENRRWFMEESLPQNDQECLDCLWLPACAGGCAWLRRQGKRDCVPWKDDPEGFVLAQYERIGEKRADTTTTPRMVGEKAAPLLRKWGIARAWVYGSVALGTAHDGSDIDMIVQMPPGEYLGFNLFKLRRELREAFGRKVDLHTPPTPDTNKAIARTIERTKVLVYDADRDCD